MTWARLMVVVVMAVAVLCAAAGPAAADTQSFSNPTTVSSGGASDIAVSGMTGTTSKLTVTVNYSDFSVAPPSHLDVVLVSPSGKGTILMSDTGGAFETPSATVTYDDAAAGPVPPAITDGVYKPTDEDPPGDPDNFGVEPPAGTTDFDHALDALNGADPNGTWKLYVADDGMPNIQARMFLAPVATGWSMSVTTVAPQPGPDPTPTPDPAPQPQQPQDPTAPQIVSAEFRTPPQPGQPTFLHVVARDADSPVTGIIVDFGEALGLFAESACQVGQKLTGGTVEFDIPYRYASSGAKEVKLTLISGGCGIAQTTTTTKTVMVGGASSSRARARTSDTLAGPDITSKCKDANLLPSRPKTKRILKALLCVMNEQRKLAKLKPLKSSKTLTKAALAHTRSMITGKFFAHQGPKELALGSRLKKAKYRGSAGENIGAGASTFGTPLAMVNGWMHSSLHRANLLSKRWRTVGIGYLSAYPLPTSALPVATYTTDFGVRP